MGHSRQKYHSELLWRKRKKRCIGAIIALFTISRSKPDRTALLRRAKRYGDAADQLAKLSVRSMHISATDFHITFNGLSVLDCTQLFCFCRADVHRLIPVLAWPPFRAKTARNGCTVSLLLTMCVTLPRLSTAARWCDFEMVLGKFSPQLSEIFRNGIHRFMPARAHLLISAIPESFVSDRAEDYASAVSGKSSYVQNCISFIDGTVLCIARLDGESILHQTVYNGHKCKDLVKFQAMTAADGHCLHLHGPEAGRCDDFSLYASSQM